MVVVGATLGLVSQLGVITPVAVGRQRPAAESIRVIDGDTFDYRGQRIRIADIDTPEIDGRCAAERDRAQAAKRRLRTLIGDGGFSLIPSGRDEDPYGRKLRLVMRGGRSVGAQLVSEGLARRWEGRRRPWC